MEECQYGIHDLSRTELDAINRLPRFNMPLELGIFLAIKRMGGKAHRRKFCLILDKSAHRYQKFISDIAGQDIRAHNKRLDIAISVTRNWLRSCSGRSMPGGKEIHRQYKRFNTELPRLCMLMRLRTSELTHNDFTNFVTEWLRTDLAADWLKKQLPRTASSRKSRS
jgi:hypothetical protein